MKTNFSKFWSRRRDRRSGSVAITHETKAESDLTDEPWAEDTACGFFVSGEPVQFRPMTTADLDEVMVIERISFRFPWSAGFFRQELQVACARSILAETAGKIIGYVLFWILPGAIDIHNIAVHADYRRQGVARVLLRQVVGEARRQSITRVMLEVRKSNLPAQKLYQTMGFLTTGIRKGYYSDNGEDALAMTLELNANP
jgi:[ribosomal protein S18]-alanine N-acetyltransferase